jgi:hypothetical protein
MSRRGVLARVMRGGSGGLSSRRRRRTATRRPLAAAGVPCRYARLGLPSGIQLLKVGDLVELSHGLRCQIRKTKHQGLNSRSAEVSRLDPRRRPMQATVKSRDDVCRLGAVGRPQNIADLIWRAHCAMTRASHSPVRSRQTYRAESHTILIADQSRPTARDQAV